MSESIAGWGCEQSAVHARQQRPGSPGNVHSAQHVRLVHSHRLRVAALPTRQPRACPAAARPLPLGPPPLVRLPTHPCTAPHPAVQLHPLYKVRRPDWRRAARPGLLPALAPRRRGLPARPQAGLPGCGECLRCKQRDPRQPLLQRAADAGRRLPQPGACGLKWRRLPLLFDVSWARVPAGWVLLRPRMLGAVPCCLRTAQQAGQLGSCPRQASAMLRRGGPPQACVGAAHMERMRHQPSVTSLPDCTSNLQVVCESHLWQQPAHSKVECKPPMPRSLPPLPPPLCALPAARGLRAAAAYPWTSLRHPPPALAHLR